MSDTEQQMDTAGACMLTLRMIMQGKEVGSIIGKKGENIKRLREESGAKVQISDGSTPERLVSVTGTQEKVLAAITTLCTKFDEDTSSIILRLVVQQTQCGSIIGKGGAKIKEIREQTGANIQVSADSLANSTERIVSVSGNSHSVIECVDKIICILLESPPKGANIPYRPKPQVPSPGMMYGGAQAQPGYPMQQSMQQTMGQQGQQPDLSKTLVSLQQTGPVGHIVAQNLASHAGSGGNQGVTAASVVASQILNNPGKLNISNGGAMASVGNQTIEMTVPNDLIGCIIGRGGSKIQEIRQQSGAHIKISPSEDGNPERTVMISGSHDAVALARLLIDTS